MKIEIEVPDEIVSNLLHSAFGGGSSYWIASTECVLPESMAYDKDIHRHDIPLLAGGMIVVITKEESKKGLGTRYTVTVDNLKAGLAIMRSVSPHQFGKVTSAKSDAETGDVFLQCCLFGDVIYS